MHILYFCKPHSDVEFSFYFTIVMKEIFAQRFKSARLMKGYSLQDLADALGNQWTRQSLFRYEKGEVIPDSNKIYLLGKALGVDPGYFFRPPK
jgi:transcriptional regulator with XRE-family HTH domain